MINTDRAKVLAATSSTLMSAKLFEFLPERPIITTAKVMDLLSTTRPTANKAIHSLLETKILKEITGKKRDREFGYIAYMDLLKVGAEL